MIAGSSQNLAAPLAPTLTARTAGSNETALTGYTASIAIEVTALNYFGETIAGTTSSNTTVTAGQVVDVQISPVAGAQQYNLYLQNNNTGNYYLMAGTSVQSGTTSVGAADRELHRRPPVHPPGADRHFRPPGGQRAAPGH